MRPSPNTRWEVVEVEGSALVGNRAAARSTKLYIGQVLRTVRGSSVIL